MIICNFNLEHILLTLKQKPFFFVTRDWLYTSGHTQKSINHSIVDMSPISRYLLFVFFYRGSYIKGAARSAVLPSPSYSSTCISRTATPVPASPGQLLQDSYSSTASQVTASPVQHLKSQHLQYSISSHSISSHRISSTESQVTASPVQNLQYRISSTESPVKIDNYTITMNILLLSNIQNFNKARLVSI
jgi:hypothetical protein